MNGETKVAAEKLTTTCDQLATDINVSHKSGKDIDVPTNGTEGTPGDA